MTKKDYELIASIFQECKRRLREDRHICTEESCKIAAEVLSNLTLLFSLYLKADNRNFDKDKFIKACTK